MTAVLVIALLMNAIALPLAARRVSFIYRLIGSGQPAPDRVENVTRRTSIPSNLPWRGKEGDRRATKLREAFSPFSATKP